MNPSSFPSDIFVLGSRRDEHAASDASTDQRVYGTRFWTALHPTAATGCSYAHREACVISRWLRSFALAVPGIQCSQWGWDLKCRQAPPFKSLAGRLRHGHLGRPPQRIAKRSRKDGSRPIDCPLDRSACFRTISEQFTDSATGFPTFPTFTTTLDRQGLRCAVYTTSRPDRRAMSLPVASVPSMLSPSLHRRSSHVGMMTAGSPLPLSMFLAHWTKNFLIATALAYRPRRCGLGPSHSSQSRSPLE